MVEIRRMAWHDLEYAVAQTTREGWASGRHLFEVHLEHDPSGCFVAETDGEPVGMVTTTRFPESGWIGNLIVAPEQRSRGIGRALMVHGLAQLEAQGAATVRLDGDPPGIPLYRSLGFADEWSSLRFRGRGCAGAAPAGVAALEVGDLPDVARFDREIFGDDRAALLRLGLEHARRAFLLRRSGAVAGFALMDETDRGMHLGPWVAEDVEVAAELLHAARIAAGPDGPMILGMPEANHDGRRLLEEGGFAATPPSLRMIRGPRAAAGRPRLIFGIGGGAIG